MTVSAGLDREFVLERCRYFAAVNLWPTVGEGCDPEGWLGNFDDQEERHALYLLNAYLYFSDRIVDRVFVEAFLGLSNLLANPCDGPEPFRRLWREFVSRALIVPVRGERPNPSDSGTLFVRRARRLLAIEEHRLLEPAAATAQIESATELPVVFVDDFVGSGNQFITTWEDRRDGAHSSRASFRDLAAGGAGRYYYCPVVATTSGVEAIARACPEVVVHPGHLLPGRYNALAADSLIWPPDLQPTAEEFVRLSSERAGIPTDPGSTRYWKGFRGLGLALGFEHGTPDATLPLFDWNLNGWTPLWRP